ncbi:hypothetical protein B0H12DRAFT_523334 [Mycena haematopus]|nr:hypothetical protein B0H12DRAFT_523334 [Mycena haematopus]
MSFLRNILKHNQPDAASIKSSGGTESLLSAVTGGNRIPKRRRPDHSRLGVPEWYTENPPPAPLMLGTAAPSPPPAFTAGNASALYVPEGEKPWLELVLYSHARPESKAALYHNAAKISGEVRMVLSAPTKHLKSIDVWVVVLADSSLDTFKLPMMTMTVNVWNRKKEALQEQTGTFVFPFEFPALPKDTLVKHPDITQQKNIARVPLPPTYFVSEPLSFWGNIKYIAGVNVAREGFGAIDDEFDTPFQYMPLCKPLPRVKTSFPYIPTREDWPFNRELVGGWTLTPFGGRGRLHDEVVEVEGILGIQEPAVYTTGQMLEFSLLLWSANPRALEALGQPGAVGVEFCQADVFGLNSLDPRKPSEQDRVTKKIATGRAWRADDGRPADDAPATVAEMVVSPGAPAGQHATPFHTSGESHHEKGKLPSRMREMHVSQEETDAETPVAEVSPAPSLEDLDAQHSAGHLVRLDGEVRVPACSSPSFRYMHMGREYFLNLLIRHPQYTHISPSGPGLVAECPVWYVIDRFAHLPAGTKKDFDLFAPALPVSGSVIPVGSGAVRAPVSMGRFTNSEEKRPTSKFARMR